MVLVIIHAGCVDCPNSFLPPVLTPYHSIIHHSFLFPHLQSYFYYFFFPNDRITHFLLLILLARWPLTVCLDLCTLHIAAYPSTIAACWKLVYLQLPLLHASPLFVTANSPTNSTCKPPSRCCPLYYDNLRPAWDTFKTKVNLFRSVGSVRRPWRIYRLTTYICLNRHTYTSTLEIHASEKLLLRT